MSYECEYPRCGKPSSITLYSHPLCDKHWGDHCDQRAKCEPGQPSKVETKVCGKRELAEIEECRKHEKDIVIPEVGEPEASEPSNENEDGIQTGNWNKK